MKLIDKIKWKYNGYETIKECHLNFFFESASGNVLHSESSEVHNLPFFYSNRSWPSIHIRKDVKIEAHDTAMKLCKKKLKAAQNTGFLSGNRHVLKKGEHIVKVEYQIDIDTRLITFEEYLVHVRGKF